MKNLKSYTFSISFVLVLTGMLSCTKMDHYYKDYVIERTYVGTPDSLWVYAGNNRMQLNWLTPTDPRAQSLVILWNNGRDSATATVNHNASTDNFIVNDLPEGPFTFNVIFKDKDGNRSVKKELTTEIFGEKYQNRLANRKVDYWVRYTDSIIVFITPSGDKSLLFSVIEYKDKNGQTKTTRLKSNETMSSLTDIDVSANSIIGIKSGFYPGNNVIDTFYSSTETFDLENFRAPNSFTLDIPSDATIDFIDFNLVKVHTYAPASVANITANLQETFDMGHLRGGGSKHNFVAVTSGRPSAFSSVLYSGISGFTIRNAGYFINMGDSETATNFYDNLDEDNRSAMITAFYEAEALFPSADAYWPINQDQVILLKSTDRNIYVAMKATSVNPDGAITFKFKISRP